MRSIIIILVFFHIFVTAIAQEDVGSTNNGAKELPPKGKQFANDGFITRSKWGQYRLKRITKRYSLNDKQKQLKLRAEGGVELSFFEKIRYRRIKKKEQKRIRKANRIQYRALEYTQNKKVAKRMKKNKKKAKKKMRKTYRKKKRKLRWKRIFK